MRRAEYLAEEVGRFSRAHLHLSQRVGDRAAAKIVGGMGSWRFFFVQTVVVLSWVAANLYLLSKPFDPYPFILLNLAFSTQAAYAAPLILMASNLQSRRDRLRDDQEAREVEELHQMGETTVQILKGQDETLAKQDEILTRIDSVIAQLKGRA